MRKTIEEHRIYSDFEGGRLWAVVKKTAKTITVQGVTVKSEGEPELMENKKTLKLSEIGGLEVAKQKNITLFADCHNVYGVKIQFEKFEEFEKKLFGGEETPEETTTATENETEADEMNENKANNNGYELECYSSAIFDKAYFDGLKDEKGETETAETETETTTAAEEETATAETTTETATAEPTATAETAETTTENATETTTAETEEPPTIEEIAAEIKATCGDDRLKIWEEVTAWAESGKTNIAKLEIAELLFESLGFLEKGEKLHTFLHWKNNGYSVKKGEKTFLRMNIWKSYEQKTDKNENGEEEKETKFFIKNACFFASHQVEKSGYTVKKDNDKAEKAAAYKTATAAKTETAETATAEAVTAEEKEKAAKITEIKAATETTGKGLDLRGYCRINGHHITFFRRNGYTESGNRSKDVKKSTWNITCPTLSNPWAVYVYTPYSVYNANVYSYTLANSKIYNYNYQQRIEPQTAAADDSIYNLIYTMLKFSEKPENNKKRYKFENEKAKAYFITEYEKHKTAKETAEKAAAEIAEYLNSVSLPEAVKSTLEIQLKAEKKTAEQEGKQFAALCEVFKNCGEKPQK